MALAVGFTKAYFTESVTDHGLLIVDKGTAVGGLPAVPSPWMVTASTEYQFPIGATLVGYLRAQDIFHSRNPGPFTEHDPASINYWPTLRADPVTNEVNLRLGMTWSRFELELFVFNALNAQPILQRNSDAPGSTLLYATTLRPRMMGATVSWRF
jgi:iron complex outermembrane recepter protein